MPRAIKLVLCAFLAIAVCSSTVSATDKDIRAGRQIVCEGTDVNLLTDNTNLNLMSAAVDTYMIVYYDFESHDWQGWTRVDNTAQVDTFFHADDFAGLGGGTYGMLTPINGSISMWCGARPDTANPYVCSWVNAPGYGNDWNQMLESDKFSFTGQVTISYKLKYYLEENYDSAKVEYYDDGQWNELASYTGVGNVQRSHTVTPTSAATKLRFHIITDGEGSDQDGQIDTDGAAIVDDILVFDNSGLICNETFESWSPGEKSHTGSIWHASVKEGYGKYSGLISNIATDKDPCNTNLSTQVVFFVGSEYPSEDYPGLFDTPFCKGSGGKEAPCQDEYILSPVIDLTKYSTGRNEVQDADIPPEKLPKLAGYKLGYTIYYDLPQQNLVFYYWDVRTIDESGCPGEWKRPGIVIGYHPPDYSFQVQDIANLIDGDRVQLRFGVVDMCDEWYLTYGDCENHTPAPWFDNIYIKRYDTSGPQWWYSAQYLFQDNFPETGDLESYVRADMANDINAIGDPVCRPGDSVIVTCTSPIGGGIAVDGGGPRVFLHVKVHYIGDPSSPKPDLAGPDLEGTYGHYVSDDGTWTVIQGENGSSEDTYIFDLNDSLLTRGYEVSYYFKAFDNEGESTTLPSGAAEGEYFEFTCLPTLASDILYVDDYHGRGSLSGKVELFLDPTFKAVLPEDNQPDRYDINTPAYDVGNDLSTRALPEHLRAAYSVIIWDSGNLDNTISEGAWFSGKGNDCALLLDWLDNSERDVGLWIMGNNTAWDFDSNHSSAQSDELMNTWCGVQFVHYSYFDLTGGFSGGGVATPLLKGHSEGIFYHGGVPDSLYIIGSCPYMETFDCLGKAGTSASYALQYPDYNGQQYYAAIQNSRGNSQGHTARTMWFGFSFMYIDDASLASPIIRNHIMKDVFDFFGSTTNEDVTGEEIPVAYSLSQNFPNPFNPSTTIRFSMKEKGHVSIKIYDISGKLVRTIADGVFEPGNHTIAWDGRNDSGRLVSSGVYFYKMKTRGFERTRKMVLLR